MPVLMTENIKHLYHNELLVINYIITATIYTIAIDETTDWCAIVIPSTI